MLAPHEKIVIKVLRANMDFKSGDDSTVLLGCLLQDILSLCEMDEDDLGPSWRHGVRDFVAYQFSGRLAEPRIAWLGD